MLNTTLCYDYDICNYTGKCDRNPDSCRAISERQNWACFKGTEECPAEGGGEDGE